MIRKLKDKFFKKWILFWFLALFDWRRLLNLRLWLLLCLMNRRKDNATNPASKQYHTLFTLCQIYDLMGHPTGEKQKNEETDEIISNKADYTFQVMIFNCIGYIRIPVVPQLLFKQLHEPSIYYSYWFLSFSFPFISFWIFLSFSSFTDTKATLE